MAEPLADRVVHGMNWLEPVAELIQKIVGGIYGALGPLGRFLKNVMHGTYVLRHPLHPMLVDVPLGAWTTGIVADYAAIYWTAIPPVAGDLALADGVVAGAGAVASGYTDHHETQGHERRVATVHGLIMTVVLIVELVSLGMRIAGPSRLHGAAVGVGTAGLLLALFGAYFGGHLTYAIGTMVNRNAFAEGPTDFVAVGAAADFPENSLKRVDAGGMPILLVRLQGRLHGIAATCSHAGGPLDEGTVDRGIVTCPWHQSRFRLSDGTVTGGPATFNQPSFKVREHEGKVEVRLARPLH